MKLRKDFFMFQLIHFFDNEIWIIIIYKVKVWQLLRVNHSEYGVYMDSELFDYPVDGTLDLHMFKPSDVKSALSEYLLQCRIHGITYVRIIHGKGHGVLRQIVHSYLDKCNFVREYKTAPDISGWGATLAIIEPLNERNSNNSNKEWKE